MHALRLPAGVLPVRPFPSLRTILLTSILTSPAVVQAEACKVDAPPAATLLLPYFEVDLSRADGVTTMFSIGNATSSATLAHVTVWTDLGVPTLDFMVYLTGWDIETLNVRDVFNGILPRTASDGQDPTDTVSPQGQYSQDVNFASCQGILPHPAVIPQSFIAHLRAAHTGASSALQRIYNKANDAGEYSATCTHCGAAAPRRDAWAVRFIGSLQLRRLIVIALPRWRASPPRTHAGKQECHQHAKDCAATDAAEKVGPLP